MPWTEEKLRQIPPFEFENWAVIALGGIPNKTQVGDMGIDGRIFPVAAAPTKAPAAKGQTPAFEEFLDHWYPIQVKQKDKVGWPDIDAFFRKSAKAIIALTVREILEEEIARKLA